MTCIRSRAFVTTVANAHPAVVIRQTTPDAVALRLPCVLSGGDFLMPIRNCARDAILGDGI